jgi:hypothetical protein
VKSLPRKTIAIAIAVVAASLLLLWACYPAVQVTYSNPQESSVNQWLIEFTPSESKLQLSMRVQRESERGGFHYSNQDFGITLEQLVGLTRDQVMSSGTNVRFN